MKLSKYNYYLKTGDSVNILNIVSTKIVSIPASILDDGCQIINIERADQGVLLDLQELGMAYDDDIDEKRILSFWEKKQAYDESCFKVNIHLDGDIDDVLGLFGMAIPDIGIVENGTIIDMIFSVSSMMLFDSIEINLIGCEYVSPDFLKRVCCLIKSQNDNGDGGFFDAKVNFVYGENSFGECTELFLKECGYSGTLLKYLDGLKSKDKIIFGTIVSKDESSTLEKISLKVQIVFGINNLDAVGELISIPEEFRSIISVSLCLYSQVCTSSDCALEIRSETLDNLISDIVTIVKLGYNVNPVELFQNTCPMVGANTISISSTGNICKCAMYPIRTLKIDRDIDVSSQLYQYLLSEIQYLNDQDECINCAFFPWCRRNCLLSCKYKGGSVGYCPREIYERISGAIITAWRLKLNEIT